MTTGFPSLFATASIQATAALSSQPCSITRAAARDTHPDNLCLRRHARVSASGSVPVPCGNAAGTCAMAALIRRGDAFAARCKFGGQLLPGVEGAYRASVRIGVRSLAAEAGGIKRVGHGVPKIQEPRRGTP